MWQLLLKHSLSEPAILLNRAGNCDRVRQSTWSQFTPNRKLIWAKWADRIQKLAAGEVDIVAASMTHKCERNELIDFIQTYFQDGQSLLVRADSGINSLAGLNGKTVAAIEGSTTVENRQSAANLPSLKINLLPFHEYAQALKAGQVDRRRRASPASYMALASPGTIVVSNIW